MLELIVTNVVVVFSLGLTYVLGRLEVYQSDKKAAYREAYDSFFLPFISLLYKTQIWEVGFAHLSEEYRSEIINLLLNNIKYMNNEILESVNVLCFHRDSILFKEVLDMDSIFTHDRADEIFDDLMQQVTLQANKLAKKLHLPRIGEFSLELYRFFREGQKSKP